MHFFVEVRVVPQAGILDPQGEAVHGALRSLGFAEVTDVRVGRLITLSIDAEEAEEAHRRAEVMCQQLLANPVTEDYSVRVREAPSVEPAR